MQLWTFQGIEIYDQMMREGITYCSKPTMGDNENFMYCYRWMAQQMRERIGEPPLSNIEFPMWAWYQYHSRKKRKPTLSCWDIPQGKSVFMEIELPSEQVLLSDFSMWHSPLNFTPVKDFKRIWKKMEQQDKLAGKMLDFFDYPLELQQEIADSWTDVFDFSRRDKSDKYGLHTSKRNRSIQATFWALRPSDVVDVIFFEHEGKSIKQSKLPNDS